MCFEDERLQIADLRRAGAGVPAIAERLGRSPSTISRELRRNRDPGGGRYRPFTAHKLAAQRRARLRAGKIARDEALRQFVQGRLEKRWSPQQISRALRAQFPGEAARHVVHETIYQAVYRPELGGLSRELPARALRSGRRRRRPHRRPGERRPNGITAMTMIGQRPAEAAGRQEPGHWEGDLITGASNRSAIGTLVDQASSRHTAEAVRDALIAAFCQLPPQLRRSPRPSATTRQPPCPRPGNSHSVTNIPESPQSRRGTEHAYLPGIAGSPVLIHGSPARPEERPADREPGGAPGPSACRYRESWHTKSV